MQKTFVIPGSEPQQWSLWDSGDCAAATTELNLFKVATGGTKTKLQTNMEAAGEIKAGMAFDVYSIAVQFRDSGAAAIVAADARKVLYLGYLQFNINGREQFAAPLSFLPGGGGLNVQYGALTDICFTNGVTASASRYFFKRAVRIKQNVPWQIDLKWPVATAVSATVTIVVFLDGLLHRIKQ